MQAGRAGGQGTVITAMHKNGAVFALKISVLTPIVAGVGGHAVYDNSEGSALHEAELATSMVYPFVVPSLGSFIHADRLFLVMKQLVGSLDVAAVTSDAMRARTARDVLTQTSFALEYVHAKGIVHCDIKPDNVLVSDKSDSALCDFGIARRVVAGTGDFAPQGESHIEAAGYMRAVLPALGPPSRQLPPPTLCLAQARCHTCPPRSMQHIWRELSLQTQTALQRIAVTCTAWVPPSLQC